MIQFFKGLFNSKSDEKQRKSNNQSLSNKIDVDSKLRLVTPTKNDVKLIKDLQDDYNFNYYIKFDAPPSKLVQGWIDMQDDSKNYIWIIKYNSKSIGFITCNFLYEKKIADINFALLPVFRRKGIITKCLHKLINLLQREKIISLHAHVSVKNKSSIKLIEKIGFKRRELFTGGFYPQIDIIDLWSLDYNENIFSVIRGDENLFKKIFMTESGEQQFLSKLKGVSFLDPTGPDYIDYYGKKQVVNLQKKLNKFGLVLNMFTDPFYFGALDSDYPRRIDFELIREEHKNNTKYINIRVCSDEWRNAESLLGIEIGIPKRFIAMVLQQLMVKEPQKFSCKRLGNTIGLEGFVFHNDSIVHW